MIVADHHDLRLLLPALRGAPITCFIGLLLLGGKANGAQIAAVTGYDEETARKSLVRLEGVLLARVGRYHWQVLSQTWLQSPLLPADSQSAPPATGTDKPGPATPLALPRESLTSATGSVNPRPSGPIPDLAREGLVAATGSVNSRPPQYSSDRGNSAVPPNERGNSAFPDRRRGFKDLNQVSLTPSPSPPQPDEHEISAVEIAALLEQQSGYPAYKALPTIRAALAAGRQPGRMKCQIVLWTIYATSDRWGHGIDNVPGFIASRLFGGLEPPVFIKPRDWREENLLRHYQAEDLPAISAADPEPESEPEPEPVPPPEPPCCNLWQQALAQLRFQMTKATFETWLRDTGAEEQDSALVIYAKNAYAKDWLSLRLRPLIKRTVEDMIHRPIEIIVKVWQPTQTQE